MSGLGTGKRLTLHLGVVVVPYRSRSGKTGAMTTGDVATILEAKYGLMAAFYKAHQADIAKAIEGSLDGALEALMTGRRVDPFARSMGDIRTMFQRFILTGEAEHCGLPGVPTKAALRGVNHRLRHPYAKRNPRRPSFRDTGLLSSSGAAWIE